MLVINIIFIILILVLLYSVYYKGKLTLIDKETLEQNEKIREENKKLSFAKTRLQDDKNYLEDTIEILGAQIVRENERLDNAKKNTQKHLQGYLEIYSDNLEQAYQEAEDRYDKAIAKLTLEFEAVNTELDKIKATRLAAIQANVREQEIKEKLDFYCLTPKTADINDIKTLERIKPQLNNPRILSMLIWSTYFQKDMTALCNKILGLKTITGIYKITNQENDKCYIGQSVDVAKRWKDHAKCGLGIDAPQGNKLYKEMQEIGIWNFSWELLEECPREQLNEKEKFYIELYQSKDYGYNTTKGNS